MAFLGRVPDALPPLAVAAAGLALAALVRGAGSAVDGLLAAGVVGLARSRGDAAPV